MSVANYIFSFNVPVCDISFAHTNSAFFGAIDEVGTILIFSLDQKKEHKSIHVSKLSFLRLGGPEKGRFESEK